ncbi:uncharacterized protein ACMZJ9_012893 [Mantella aurantiaca]
MDSEMKTLLLLALCILAAKTEQNNVLAESEATEKGTKVGNSSPEYRTIKLNITICIPKHETNDTKFTQANQQVMENELQFTAAAVKTGPKIPCNNSSCTLDKKPELAVFVYQETPEKHLLCSANITNEDLSVTINGSNNVISITSKKKASTLNNALVSIDVVARHIDNYMFSQIGPLASMTFEIEQLLIPTTTTIPTTTSVPSSTNKKSVVVTTSKMASKQTTTPPVGHSTTIQKITKKPVITKPIIPPASLSPVISKGFSLAHGGLCGMVLLVLIPIFLN